MAGALSMFAGRDTLAGYTKEDQQFYNENFVRPMLDLREIGLGMGAGNVDAAATRGMSTAGRTFDSTRGSFRRDQERLGLATDSATAASQNRRLSLQRVIQQVDAGNRASRGAKDAQRTAQNFGMQAYGDSIAGANQTLSQIAQNEADREAQYQGAKAGAKAADMQAGAALASMALMFI